MVKNVYIFVLRTYKVSNFCAKGEDLLFTILVNKV